MNCKNHPEVPAEDRCSGCAEPMCGNCLVEIHGQKYCGSCKVMAIQGEPVIDEGSIPCKEAGSALTYAIVGLFCFGIILGPIAISKASKAKNMIREDPRLTGSGKATAATIIGVIDTLAFIAGILMRVSQFN